MSATNLPPQAPKPSFFRDGCCLVLVIALAKFALHMIFNNRYGYFRDEFDYMACGDHLAWGFVGSATIVPFLVHLNARCWVIPCGDSVSARSDQFGDGGC